MRATGAEPTNETASIPGWSRIPSTTSRPPLTRFTTPGGSSSESSTSKAICWVSGTCSEGLSTKVLPQAMANGRNQNGTIAGKLNGTSAAHGGVEVVGGRQRHAGQDLARRRVRDIEGVAAGGGRPAAGDVVVEQAG